MRWVMLLALLLVSCGGSGPPPSAPSPLLSKPVPEFSRRTVSGDQVDTKKLGGRVMVVKFFAKYCEPCKRTLPATQNLHREMADVTFIGVAEDEDKADVEEMIETFDLTFPIIHDAYNVVAGHFGVVQLPATFVTDIRGNVKWVGAPGQAEDDLEAAIAWVRGPRP